MVARNDLVQSAGIRVLLKNNKMLEQVEEPLPVKYTFNQDLEFQRLGCSNMLPINRAPDLEPFLVRGHGTHAGL